MKFRNWGGFIKRLGRSKQGDDRSGGDDDDLEWFDKAAAWIKSADWAGPLERATRISRFKNPFFFFFFFLSKIAGNSFLNFENLYYHYLSKLILYFKYYYYYENHITHFIFINLFINN